MAQARFHEGTAFAHAGEFESARLAFSQALAIRRDSDTLWNLAIVEKNTHHEVDACRHIREYLRRPDHQVSDDPAAHKLLDAMYPAIGHLRITAPSGATLAVDGQALTDRAPLADVYDVAPGEHVIRAASGTAANEVHVNSPPGAETPATIAFSTTSTGPITEPPKTETRATAFPPPTGAIILGGVGIVGLGLGIGFGLAATSKRSDFGNQNCAVVGTSSCVDIRSSQTTDSTIATVGYIGGAAFLVGGAVWWIVAPRKTTVVARSVSPLVGPGVAGLQVHGEF